jgi:hypothetical protein
MRLATALPAALSLLVGCAATPSGPELLIEPIQVDSVEVLILESFPVGVIAQVKGVVGDGCSSIHSVGQERSGSTITVRILRQRPRDAICTQIALFYDQGIRLEGQFPPGRYVVVVNGLERPFTVH